jgi:hypothetical protein
MSMIRNLAGKRLAVLATTTLACAAALATVTFDASTGTGFVGKGDVQLAFGWNNAQLQSRASGLSFTYAITDEYSAVCTWTTGEGTRGERVHNVSHTDSVAVDGVVTYDARTRNQVTGFILTGFGAVSETGEVPVVGGACPGNPGTDGVWTSVEQTGSGVGGLFVNYGTSKVLIY